MLTSYAGLMAIWKDSRSSSMSLGKSQTADNKAEIIWKCSQQLDCNEKHS